MASMEPMPDMYIGDSVLVPFEGWRCWECGCVPLVVLFAVPLVVPFVMVWSGAGGKSVSCYVECELGCIMITSSGMGKRFKCILAGLK